jgi:hypothetical protein
VVWDSDLGVTATHTLVNHVTVKSVLVPGDDTPERFHSLIWWTVEIGCSTGKSCSNIIQILDLSVKGYCNKKPSPDLQPDKEWKKEKKLDLKFILVKPGDWYLHIENEPKKTETELKVTVARMCW